VKSSCRKVKNVASVKSSYRLGLLKHLATVKLVRPRAEARKSSFFLAEAEMPKTYPLQFDKASLHFPPNFVLTSTHIHKLIKTKAISQQN